MELKQLDAKAELEQTLTIELTKALQKRGFEVKHNGTATMSAPGGVPDIEVWGDVPPSKLGGILRLSIEHV